MTEKCFECGQPAQNHHHIVPLVKGGTQTVTLCYECHAKVHDMKAMNYVELSKIGLANYKARGGLLGSARPGAYRFPKGGSFPSIEGSRKAGEISRRKADLAYQDVAQKILQLRQSGASLNDIAQILTSDGLTTRTGKPWNKVQVSRVLRRVNGK